MNNFVGIWQFFFFYVQFFHFYLMFMLLILIICKLYKPKIGPISKRDLLWHQTGTKFHTLQQTATEVLAIMSVHPLDFLRFFIFF